jgi:hypothetical protein
MKRILSELPPNILPSGFPAWTDHLERCPAIKGNYIED